MAAVLGARLRLGVWRLTQGPRTRSAIERLDELLPPRKTTTPYLGFRVVHDRSTSLVNRVRETGAYEPLTTAAIVAVLKRSARPLFLDVGANIGLVTLAVLAELPNARVVAFEPGAHQCGLLRETIRLNGLTARVELHGVALGEHPGTAEFAVHSRRHAAGDGFRDTGRSGPARLAIVRVQTLDRWWEEAGRPAVDVVKLDIEGAELLALKGAGAVVRSVRPTVFLEIDPRNVAPYPYDPDDVFAFFDRHRYRVEEVEPSEYVAEPDERAH